MLAEQDGARAELITAALLHDIGHLLHDLPHDAPNDGIDDRHENSAGHFLRRYFTDAVVQPVRLHVAAKRYLCATDPNYLSQLSPPSLQSLNLQGGPMSRDEILDFEKQAFFVRLCSFGVGMTWRRSKPENAANILLCSLHS